MSCEASPIGLDPNNTYRAISSDLDIPPIDGNPSLYTDYAKLLDDPTAWSKANPKGSKLSLIPILPELTRSLAKTSPKSKDEIITGLIVAGSRLQHTSEKIRKRSRRAVKAVESMVRKRPSAKPSPEGAQDGATCVICVLDRINNVMQYGHAFCGECCTRGDLPDLSYMQEASETVYNLYL